MLDILANIGIIKYIDERHEDTKMNRKALAIATAGNARYTNISVGDLVIAPLRDGSELVTCYVYAIDSETVSFLWNSVVFTVETEIAASCTLLLEKFNRQAIIAELLSRLAA